MGMRDIGEKQNVTQEDRESPQGMKKKRDGVRH